MEKLERQTLIARGMTSQAPLDDNTSDGGSPIDRSLKPEEPDLAFDPIAAALRQIHDHVAAEEIPEEFLRLLDRLDEFQTQEPRK